MKFSNSLSSRLLLALSLDVSRHQVLKAGGCFVAGAVTTRSTTLLGKTHQWCGSTTNWALALPTK